MSLTIGTRLGPYLVEAPIGAGGMSARSLAPVDRAGLVQVQLFSYHPATGAYSYDDEKRVSTLFVVRGAK